MARDYDGIPLRKAEPGVAAYLLQATLGGLTEPSRRLLSLLAVFRHPVDLLDERLIDASEALDGHYDVLAGLDELRRKQLVDHPARAGLHPLVRDYCYARLVGAASDTCAAPGPARSGAG